MFESLAPSIVLLLLLSCSSVKRVPVHWERRTNGRAASLAHTAFPLPYKHEIASPITLLASKFFQRFFFKYIRDLSIKPLVFVVITIARLGNTIRGSLRRNLNPLSTLFLYALFLCPPLNQTNMSNWFRVCIGIGLGLTGFASWLSR